MGYPRKETFIIVVGLLVCLTMLGVLSRGIWVQYGQLERIQAAKASLQPYLDRELETRDQLLLDGERVLSDEYVEEWARVYGGLVRPGEVRVVLEPPEAENDADAAAPSTP
jgi:cell division protein FtsB